MDVSQRRSQEHFLESMVVRVWDDQMGDFAPRECWAPLVNVYQLRDRLEICVDLAGVDAQSIDLTVEPGRLTLRGRRRPPEPPRSTAGSMQIVAMEIDHGPFCRELTIPDRLDLRRVTSEYQDGLLWVRLPMMSPG